MSNEQFNPAPAVDVLPNWPKPPAPAAPDVPQRRPDWYSTAEGITITECAVCLIDADPDDHADRPFRAITAIEGTPVCRQHLVGLDRAADIPMPGYEDQPGGIAWRAAGLAQKAGQ